nr:PREDICTED: uncharacterized protein LOC106706868 [Latimeria chalumnae]|eukprot:XP_014353881.1 PREDICTED: uncharacterized protein LOC106706868 [Latimeria chalumnae]
MAYFYQSPQKCEADCIDSCKQVGNFLYVYFGCIATAIFIHSAFLLLLQSVEKAFPGFRRRVSSVFVTSIRTTGTCVMWVVGSMTSLFQRRRTVQIRLSRSVEEKVVEAMTRARHQSSSTVLFFTKDRKKEYSVRGMEEPPPKAEHHESSKVKRKLKKVPVKDDSSDDEVLEASKKQYHNKSNVKQIKIAVQQRKDGQIDSSNEDQTDNNSNLEIKRKDSSGYYDYEEEFYVSLPKGAVGIKVSYE